MNDPASLLRERLSDLLDQWQGNELPSTYELEPVANDLLNWKQANCISGLWSKSPTMVTATLDDAIGKGIEIIQLFAEVTGIKVFPLGILQTPETIVAECNKRQPNLLGLTVLQLDTEEELTGLCRMLEPPTRVVAGGPVFAADPELARRAGLAAAIRNAAAFWDYLLTFSPAAGKSRNGAA